MFYSKSFNKRSQDLNDAYHDAGQFYWGKVNAWIKNKSFFTPKSYGYELSRHRVIDLDDKEDLKALKIIFEAKN